MAETASDDTNAAYELPNHYGPPLNIPLHVRKELLKYLQDHVELGLFLLNSRGM